LPSFEICRKLLEEEGVSSTPGAVFGESGESHLRLSYSSSLDVISEASTRIKKFVNRYAKG